MTGEGGVDDSGDPVPVAVRRARSQVVAQRLAQPGVLGEVGEHNRLAAELAAQAGHGLLADRRRAECGIGRPAGPGEDREGVGMGDDQPASQIIAQPVRRPGVPQPAQDRVGVSVRYRPGASGRLHEAAAFQAGAVLAVQNAASACPISVTGSAPSSSSATMERQ